MQETLVRQTPQKAVGAAQQWQTPPSISTGHRRLHKARDPQQPTTRLEAKSRSWWPPEQQWGNAPLQLSVLVCGRLSTLIPPPSNKVLRKHTASQTLSCSGERRRSMPILEPKSPRDVSAAPLLLCYQQSTVTQHSLLCRCATAQLNCWKWTLLLWKPRQRREEGWRFFSEKSNADEDLPGLVVDKLSYKAILLRRCIYHKNCAAMQLSSKSALWLLGEELKFAFSQDTPDCRGDLNTDMASDPKEEPKTRQGLNAFVFTTGLAPLPLCRYSSLSRAVIYRSLKGAFFPFLHFIRVATSSASPQHSYEDKDISLL